MNTEGLRFDVNCSLLFTELPLLKRPGAARAAGERGLLSLPEGSAAFRATSFGWRETDEV